MSRSEERPPDPRQLPDPVLLARHVAGDAEAFGELFRRHRDRLWAVAYRLSGDREEAADALQDAMLSAFRRAATFRGQASVTTWLHRIVVNASLDRIRRRTVRPATLIGDEAVLDSLGGGRFPADPAARLDVRAALAALPVPQRAALVLVDMLGYPVAEVAEILGISPGTVKSRCARARAKLLPVLGNPETSQNVSPQGGDQ